MPPPRVALITGATSGIGLAAAELFSKRGFGVIVCGRRRDRLDALAGRLTGPCLPLCFDVADAESVGRAVQELPVEWRRVDVLVNNAGNAHGQDLIQDGDTSDWDKMIDVNLKGVLHVLHEVLPLIPRSGSAVIINVGSIAAHEVYATGNVYCATKSAVDQLTKAMRHDLFKERVRVAALHPGLVATEFASVRYKGDEDRAAAMYKGYRPLTPSDCADALFYMATRPPHVNVADVTIMPTDQAAVREINRSKM